MPSLEENVARTAEYYKAQAPEYHEGTYGSEKVDADYRSLKAFYQDLFAGRAVLEIACGSGYWTDVISKTADSVLATDVVPELVEATTRRTASQSNVRCRVADAYTLDNVSERFTAAFGQYWWSHIPRKKYRSFLSVLHSKLAPGAVVAFTDDLDYYAKWVARRTDEHGDVYEERTLRDGSRFETIKNFPQKGEIIALLEDEGVATDIQYVEHELPPVEFINPRLWTVSYRLRG